MNYNSLCLKCFIEKENVEAPCPHCGFTLEQYALKSNCLPLPSILKGQYIVGVSLGIGGFGITYIAFDIRVGGLCAVKGYMPGTVSFRNGLESEVSISQSKRDVFDYGLSRFMEEAELLKKFSKSPNIINVYESFYENGTAYYVMEYLDGQDLKRYTNHFKERLGFDSGLQIFYQILNGLEELHQYGVIHRDISPDNIYITKNGRIKILDFGSARYSLTQRDKNLSVIVKQGYAPGEQYSTNALQGAYTDIYALGATFYHLLSGSPPPDATERLLGDTLKPLCQINFTVPQRFSDCVQKALAVKKEDRYQSIAELRADLAEKKPRTVPRAEYSVLAGTKPEVPSFKPENMIKPAPEIISQAPVRDKLFNQDNLLIRRIGASAIDTVLFLSVYLFLFAGVISAVMLELDMVHEVQSNVQIFLLLLSPFVYVLVNALLEASPIRATLGKKICGLITVGKNNMRLDNQTAIKRNFIKLLGVFLFFTENNNEYLHDRLTHSKIIFHRKKGKNEFQR